jgi:hypothetical protein
MWKNLAIGKCEWHFHYFTLMHLCYSHFSIPFVILPALHLE